MKEYRVTLDVTVQADSASAASYIAWNERYALNVRVQETQPDEPFIEQSADEIAAWEGVRRDMERDILARNSDESDSLTSEDTAFLGRAHSAEQLISATVSLAGKNARLVNRGLGPVLTDIRSATSVSDLEAKAGGLDYTQPVDSIGE